MEALAPSQATLDLGSVASKMNAQRLSAELYCSLLIWLREIAAVVYS